MRKIWFVILLALVAVSSGNRQRYSPTGIDCLACYNMNDNAGTGVVVDSAGGYDGVFTDAAGDPNTNAHSVAGHINLAFDFDGTDDCIDIADADVFTPILTPFSISAWIEMDSATSFQIVTKLEVGKEEWAFNLDASNYLTFQIWDKSYSGYIGRYYEYDMSEFQDTYIHVVATYDGGTTCGACKLYYNGAKVDDQNFTSASPWSSCENLDSKVWIGTDDTTYSDGSIDNVMIFDTELSLSEVNTLYNSGSGTETSGAQRLRERY